FAYLLLSGTTWSHFLEQTLGPSFAERHALVTTTILLFVMGYVIGQLIAPFAKLVQRIGEWKHFNPKPEATSGAYDFLRLHYKDAGSQCAKIRAEFTMYNGLAVVFLASSIWYGFYSSGWGWLVDAI